MNPPMPTLGEKIAAAQAARDDAIDRVQDHAPPDWYRLAHRAVVEVTRRHVLFTTDDVWAVLDRWDAPPPPEPRAMGAVMRDIGRARFAVPTDRTRLSERPECHRRPLRVWRATYDPSILRGAPDG